MLNGLSAAPANCGLNPVKTALSIYESISAPMSIVKPNIFHANSMLNVCAKQQDMDTLWKMAGDLPESGPGSPDPWTYTIILKAIRQSSQRDLIGVDPKDFRTILGRKAQSVREGKRIWSDILFRWNQGQRTIDNICVNALADLLQDGSSDQDYYDFFALYNQVFGIPNLAENPAELRQRHRQREGGEEGEARGAEEVHVPFVDKHNRIIEGSEDEKPDNQHEETFEGLFDKPIKIQDRLEGLSELVETSRPKPTNSELSVLLSVCYTMTQGSGIGKAYWELLTREDGEYRIKPDSLAYHEYLRLLRVSRSSRAALTLMRDQMGPADLLLGKTFHIAFSVCRRDQRNVNVFNTMNELLALMPEYLVLPDPRALMDYLDMVSLLASNPHLLMALKGIDVKPMSESGSLDEYGRQLQSALRTAAARNLHPHLVNLEMAMGQEGRRPSLRITGPGDPAIRGDQAIKALVKARHMIDVNLDLETEPLLSKEDRDWLLEETKRLRKYSAQDLTERFRDTIVIPTRQQKQQFIDGRKQKGLAV